MKRKLKDPRKTHIDYQRLSVVRRFVYQCEGMNKWQWGLARNKLSILQNCPFLEQSVVRSDKHELVFYTAHNESTWLVGRFFFVQS